MYSGLHVKYPLLLSDFSETYIHSKNTEISNVMKIRPVGAELFDADTWIDMTLIVAFRNLANAPKNWGI